MKAYGERRTTSNINQEKNELADKWAIYLDEYFKRKGSHKGSLSLESYIRKERKK